MKMLTKYIFILSVITLFITVSCKEDKLDPNSVFVNSPIPQSEFDLWLQKNFVSNYNIEVLYKYVDIESDMDYNLSPASYENSVRLAKLIKYLALEPYDEITGSKEFIKMNFPKMLNFIGSGAYNNNGTFILGTAEGGRKITMFLVNEIAENAEDIRFLNEFFFKTIHHEFGHILNQNKPYAVSFRIISEGKYIQDSWNSNWASEAAAISAGFISPYASKAHTEDFVEILSTYITNSNTEWTNILNRGSAAGRDIINSKLIIVKDYMLQSWNIDLDKLRNNIIARQNNLSNFDQLSLK